MKRGQSDYSDLPSSKRTALDGSDGGDGSSGVAVAFGAPPPSTSLVGAQSSSLLPPSSSSSSSPSSLSLPLLPSSVGVEHTTAAAAAGTESSSMDQGSASSSLQYPQLNPFQTEVLQHQYTQLKRQVLLYKNEANTSLVKLNELASQRNKDALVTAEVIRQWNQLQEDLILSLARVVPSDGSKLYLQSVNTIYNDSLPAFLDSLSQDQRSRTVSLADTPWFAHVREKCAEKHAQLVHMITLLSRAVDAQQAAVDALARERDAHWASTQSDTLAQENQRLLDEMRELQKVVTSLHDQHRKTSESLGLLHEQKAGLEASLSKQTHESDVLLDELRATQRKVIKFQEDLKAKDEKHQQEIQQLQQSIALGISTVPSLQLAAGSSVSNHAGGDAGPLTAGLQTQTTLLSQQSQSEVNSPLVLSQETRPTLTAASGTSSPFIPAEGSGEAAVQAQLKQDIIDDLQQQVQNFTRMMEEHHAAFDKHHGEKARLLDEIHALRQQLSLLPDALVGNHPMYRQLKIQCDTAVKELLDTRVLMELLQREMIKILQSRRAELEQIELAESARRDSYVEELRRLEDHYAKVKNEYDKLLFRNEKKSLSESGSSGSAANQEMKDLIRSLQNQNNLLKAEILRTRSQCDSLRVALVKVSPDDVAVKNLQAAAAAAAASSESGLPGASLLASAAAPNAAPSGLPSSSSSAARAVLESETLATIKQLREDLRKAQENEKEIMVLLNVYKSSSKEPRDRIELIASEKRLQGENAELRGKVSELEKATNAEVISEALKVAKAQADELGQQLEAQKQNEDALISEMDQIGQSYQEMQEQNARLIQQLNEKDDANFQLMADRLKATQLQQMLREEKEIIESKMTAMQAQMDAQNELLKKFEERERAMRDQLEAAEKDNHQKMQLLDGYKRKAMEASSELQQATILHDRQREMAQRNEEMLRAKSEQLESLIAQHQKLKDENTVIQTKLSSKLLKRQKDQTKDKEKEKEKAKSSVSDKTDSQLAELNQQYRQLIFCSICRTNIKDTVMLRCFHSFCNECVQKRYDTRQRACPNCAKPFGANDFQRFYL